MSVRVRLCARDAGGPPTAVSCCGAATVSVTVVVVGLDVGDARVVVDRDVQEGVAHAAPLGALGLLGAAAEHSPAAAWGDLGATSAWGHALLDPLDQQQSSSRDQPCISVQH